MKRIINSFNIIFILFGVLLLIGCSDTDKEIIHYNLSEDGTYYVITGVTDLESEELIIPDIRRDLPVKEIASFAFMNCTNLKRIYIPKSITTIGESAFQGCYNLSSITLPFIGNKLNGTENTHFGYIFGASSSDKNNYFTPKSLKTVFIENETSIKSNTFYNCVYLTNIKIEGNIKAIEQAAFYNCENLTSIILPDSITTIGKMAFYNCKNLLNINLPENLETIETSAFSYCEKLEQIRIHNNLKSIGYSAFSYCKNLKKIELPNSLTDIGALAFSYTALENIYIPKNVITVGEKIFSGCDNSLKIYCEAESKPDYWHSQWSYSDWNYYIVKWDYKNE